jgi:quinoprotein dehydrogenase-associated probable ABC transporter substrate-binding protein
MAMTANCRRIMPVGVLLFIVAGGLAVGVLPVERLHAQGAGLDQELELVDPKVLRVCADPSNLPFSNEKGEGLENKLSELLAAKLNKGLAYTWYPMATGFVRNTLAARRCDIIPGFPQGDDMVQATNPYYRTAYALVVRADSDLVGVDTLDDNRIRDKRIGVVAGTPPASYITAYGEMAKAKPYPLVVDTRIESPAQDMIRDLESGEIDAGVLWGPMAGYYAKRANPPMRVTLLLKETGGPPMTFRIAMGVRVTDQNWKRQLNRLIAENQAEINKLLLDFGVPLLDEQGRAITGDSPAK